MEFRTKQMTQSELMKYELTKEIPILSTTKAHKLELGCALELLNEEVRKYNSGEGDIEKIVGLAYGILESGDMMYADASKIELIIILAKAAQINNLSTYEEALNTCIEKFFNVIKL